MSFISPVAKVVKENSFLKKIEQPVCGMTFNSEVQHCNFCQKPVSCFPVYENSSNVDNFSFDVILEKLCCEEMKTEALKLRKDHEKEYVEFRTREIDCLSTPPIYRLFRIADFAQTGLVKKIRDFAGGLTGKGLYIYSAKNGTGKTTLSCVAAKTYCAYWGHEKYKFFNYAEFVNKYEGASFDDKRDMLEMYRECKILVIDDLGKGRLSPMSVSNIYDIINYRNVNNMVTIVSSNLSLEQIGESFDSSVASRLFEMCDLIEMKGDDRRINPAQSK